MTKHTLLKTSQTKEFRKTLTKNMFIILALCIGQLAVAFVGHLFGLDNYGEYFGSIYLAYCAVSVFVVYKINKQYVLDNEVQKEKMTPLAFIRHFSVMITMMLLSTVPVVILDMILQSMGLTIMSIGEANEVSDSITECIYVALIGPICEEVLFRGLIQKSLEKYSPVIAIITSAIGFGLYHGNFGQMFPMIGTGIVLGYVAYKYSLKWSMIIHIIYNTIFGEIFGFISDLLANGEEEYLLPIINQTPFLTAILSLAFAGICFIGYQILVKKELPFSDYKFKFKKVLLIFTSSGMIAFATYNIITALLLLEKL